MLHDSGILTVCKLTGGGLDSRLSPVSSYWYGEKTVGMGRFFTAKQANSRVDLLVQVERDKEITESQYAVLENGEQYRIVQIQQVEDEDGLPWTDLSLERLGEHYAKDF